MEQDQSNKAELDLLQDVTCESESPVGFPETWRYASVGDIIELKYGKGMKASERLSEGPVPVYGSNGIVGYTKKSLTKHPSIIIGRKGSAGALNICNGPSWTTDVAYYVEAPSHFEINYLFISLETLNLHHLGKGVKPGLSRRAIASSFTNIRGL